MLNRLEVVREFIQLNLPPLVNEESYIKVLNRLDKIEDDILDGEEY